MFVKGPPDDKQMAPRRFELMEIYFCQYLLLARSNKNGPVALVLQITSMSQYRRINEATDIHVGCLRLSRLQPVLIAKRRNG